MLTWAAPDPNPNGSGPGRSVFCNPQETVKGFSISISSQARVPGRRRFLQEGERQLGNWAAEKTDLFAETASLSFPAESELGISLSLCVVFFSVIGRVIDEGVESKSGWEFEKDGVDDLLELVVEMGSCRNDGFI